MSEEPKLLGDMTEAMLKKVGADKLAKYYERISGRPCNCAGRKQALNNIQRAVQRAVTPRDRTVLRPPHNPPTQTADEAPRK